MKKLLFIALLSLPSMIVNAQLNSDMYLRYKDVDNKKTTVGKDSSLIIAAVQPALYVVRQQFRLERDGSYYGRKGQQHYGETFSLGVKVSNATILQRCVVLPWENDADYNRVSAGGKYAPELFRSYQRQLSSLEWQSVEFDFYNLTRSMSNDSLLFESLDKVPDFGLPVDETPGKKEGYMIWAYSTSNLMDSIMQVMFNQESITVEAKGDNKPIDIKPSNNNVLGGIYVIPKVERAGYIQVLLVGVAARNTKNEWKLGLLTRGSSEDNSENPTISDKPRKRKKDPKEKPVETPDDSEPTPTN